jgi:hypothetical protein
LWPLVHAYRAQHLVLDLQQIVRIEELSVPKQRVRHGIWTRIEARLLPQRAVLALFASVCRHARTPEKAVKSV